MRRSSLMLPTAVAVLIAVAGCGGGNAVTDSGSAGSPESATASAENQAQDDSAGGTDVDNAVDACDLLSAADVEPYVGDGVEGRENPTGGDGGSCTWTNQTTYNSVSLEIGLSGTAPGGDLPPWDDSIGPEKPLGDGLRSTAGGQVEFVVDTRDCFLQVATTSGGDDDERAAVELIGKVREQL